jgi:hypothetical protein
MTEKQHECAEVDGLNKVVVKPGLARTATVFVLAVSGDSDDDSRFATGVIPELLSDLIAVHTGKADTEKVECGLVDSCFGSHARAEITRAVELEVDASPPFLARRLLPSGRLTWTATVPAWISRASAASLCAHSRSRWADEKSTIIPVGACIKPGVFRYASSRYSAGARPFPPLQKMA